MFLSRLFNSAAALTLISVVAAPALAQDRQSPERKAKQTTPAQTDDLTAPETEQESASGYLKIGDIKGESTDEVSPADTFIQLKGIRGESQDKGSDPDAQALSGDANLDGRVDFDDLNSAAATDSEKEIAAPKPGPRKTSFGVLLSSGSEDDAPQKPAKEDEGGDD